MKRCSTSLVIWEGQNKLSQDATLHAMQKEAKIKVNDKPKCGQVRGAAVLACVTGGSEKRSDGLQSFQS